MAILFLFTANYPYSVGEEFIETEIDYLARTFETVYIVPRVGSGHHRPVPSNVKVLSKPLHYSRWVRLKRQMQVFASKDFYRECFRARRFLKVKGVLRHIYNHVSHPILISDYVKKFILEHSFQDMPLVFYSHWLEVDTLGFLQLKKDFPYAHYWSRAHGYDIYPEQNNPPFLLFRPKVFEAVSAVFCDSATGRNHLAKNYPRYVEKFKFSYVGVPDPGFMTHSSADGVFRIVTCSFLVPVKRLFLFMQGLACFAKEQPAMKIQWNHIGDGPLKAALLCEAEAVLPDNVCLSLKGYLPNRQVVRYYGEAPVDLFVNVSESEGLPVSIVEAQSCGIPVMATAVGGNPEIVNNENGLLLSANPSPEEIARGLSGFAFAPEKTASKKIKCKEFWRENFYADTNYGQFVRHILNGKAA